MFILDSILVIIFTVHIYFVGIFNLFFLFPGRINQKEKKAVKYNSLVLVKLLKPESTLNLKVQPPSAALQ